MTFLTHKTTSEIQADMARRLKELRLSQNISQEEIARRTSIAKSTVQSLETTGKGSVRSLVQVLHALGKDASEAIALPESSVRPMDIFEEKAPRQRARKSAK